MKRTLLTAKNVCKSFAHEGGQIHVCNHVNLELYEGDFTVIMGTSGSGKSTLLYVLSGMDKATAGEVLYQGSDLTAMKEKQLAALRKQDFGFILQLATRLEQARQTEKLLEQRGLSQVKNHLPSQVSGGQQQRCAIARAVIHTPKLLFADEPTGALNRANTTEVLNLLTQYNQAGQSILMVTHDLRAALRADRILYLEDGKITGELKLPPYDAKEENGREAQVNAWLTSQHW